MPKHNFMISKAVDLVARKLAGMDAETVARLTQVLSEEAQMISEELQHSGQNVSSDILAAKLEGLVARMKYEVRNKGPDPSPHEFPIFNVSHNPTSPYPNPINHLYDKRYKEAYATFIKQDPPASSTSQKSEPPTPTSPSSSQLTINPKASSYPTYPQGQSQQPSSKHTSHSTGSSSASRQQPPIGWQYVNPYATMPRSHAAYYQQQAAKTMPPIQEQSVRRSSTGEDLHSQSLSHSASSNELNYPTNSGAEKIRVRVINDNSASSSTNPQLNTYPNNRPNTQRPVFQSNNAMDDNKDIITRRIYAPPNTDIGTETMQDLFKVVNSQRSEPTRSTASPMTERIIIIDRRGAGPPDNNSNAAGKERYRTFEIRSSVGGVTPTTTSVAATSPPSPAATTSTPSSAYAMQQPTYYPGQQVYYQQPKMYMSAPSILYSAATPYVAGANTFYPFGYYPY